MCLAKSAVENKLIDIYIKTEYNIYTIFTGGIFMKFRHFMWILTGLVAVVSMAAGVAVLVNRYLAVKNDTDYIECDCDDDEDEPQPEITVD